MAGKAKSCYLTVTVKGTHQGVFTKMFFNAKDMANYLKQEQFITNYPPTKFDYVKETY